MNILFVCTGNTCRSPMAEGLLRQRAEERGLDIQALSVGLFCVPGAPVSEESVKALEGVVDISQHSSRPLKVAHMEAADLVIPMTEDHKAILLRQFPFMKDKIMTFKEWAGESGDIDDPFGSSQDVYEECAEMMKVLLEKALNRL